MFTRIAKTKHASASLFDFGILGLYCFSKSNCYFQPGLFIKFAFFISMYSDLNQRLWAMVHGPKERGPLSMSITKGDGSIQNKALPKKFQRAQTPSQ